MPRISKKRKVCIASTAKACKSRKALRVPDDHSDVELHFDSEEEDSEDADSDVDEEEEEPVIEEDTLARLMAIAIPSIDSDSLAKQAPNFKYQRGVQPSRKALYLTRKKQADLQHAAANTAKITEFFISKATTNTDPVNTNPVNTDPVNTDPVNTDSVNTDPINTDSVQLAIYDLKALLRSKRTPIGQNFNRHNTVLLFLQLQLRKPQESQRSLSLFLAEACSCSDKMA
ncbi:hypothetical protein L211DRAFT_853836 [Terfezia boudieri ATCC MYA-4762]|uniref:Uncharacterized protein n=1 Tax=Terfezia boudieri ATCC MYA-4762 TaxID=1051890 RepID=A0A3N4L790_9PEZI|nr:hypothetical protein L211DRAFT_853836 [Terfezia boudieri ATCC MYA-4762]